MASYKRRARVIVTIEAGNEARAEESLRQFAHALLLMQSDPALLNALQSLDAVNLITFEQELNRQHLKREIQRHQEEFERLSKRLSS